MSVSWSQPTQNIWATWLCEERAWAAHGARDRELEEDEHVREHFNTLVHLVDSVPVLASHAADVFADYGHYLEGVGDAATALRMFRRELALVEARPRDAAYALSNVANAMDSLGHDPCEAIVQVYERSLALARQVRDARLELTVLENTDFVLRKHGHIAQAAHLAADLERLRAQRRADGGSDGSDGSDGGGSGGDGDAAVDGDDDDDDDDDDRSSGDDDAPPAEDAHYGVNGDAGAAPVGAASTHRLGSSQDASSDDDRGRHEQRRPERPNFLPRQPVDASSDGEADKRQGTGRDRSARALQRRRTSPSKRAPPGPTSSRRRPGPASARPKDAQPRRIFPLGVPFSREDLSCQSRTRP